MPLKFFLLVFALSIPFYVLGALTGFSLTTDLPISVLMVVVPAIAAAILVHREQGNAGVVALFQRSLDYKRTKTRLWYVPVIFLKPSIVLLTYAHLRVTGLPPSIPQFRILVSFGMFAHDVSR
jgi:CAAX protease family protein